MGNFLEQAGELTWLDTDAGHLILMSAAVRSLWSGIEPSRDPAAINVRYRFNPPSDPPSDYDRACEIDDYVGIIGVGSKHAIVLGQDPLAATLKQLADGSAVIARLYTSEIGVPAHLPAIATSEWQSVGSVVFDSSPVVLFDSTEVGWEEPVFPSVSTEIVLGRYDVAHAQYTDAALSLWLVRLQPI